MARQNILTRSSGSRQGKNVNVEIIPLDEKIPVEIRDIIRIKPQDFAALKSSWEKWAAQWEI